MVFMCTKAKKNIISTSEGKLESLQNHCPLFISRICRRRWGEQEYKQSWHLW